MNERITHLLAQMAHTEAELTEALQTQPVHFQLHGRRVTFAPEVRRAHHAQRLGLWAWLVGQRPQNLLTGPIIYAMVVPLLLLDACISIYQALCFPIYGIHRVRRRDYLVFDRHQLGYLNLVEKFHCSYCEYGNGLMAYTREVLARTEQYFCPIKHAHRVRGTHARYASFLAYGDGHDYEARLEAYRVALGALPDRPPRFRDVHPPFAPPQRAAMTETTSPSTGSTALSSVPSTPSADPTPPGHCVLGFFGETSLAEATRERLLSQGLPAAQLQLFQPTNPAAEPVSGHPTEAGSDATLKDMLVDGAIGGAAGAGLGALAELALVAANVSLFVASPLLAPLVMLGWGATVGATVGAVVGAEKKSGPLSALIRDAVAQGQTVLLADTRTPIETQQAQSVIQSATDDLRTVRQGVTA